MFISTSTLGMDATTTHRDVKSNDLRQTSGGAGPGSSHFSLNIPAVDLDHSVQRIALQSQRISADSLVTTTSGQPLERHSQERYLGQAVSEILNQKVSIRETSPIDSRENMILAPNNPFAGSEGLLTNPSQLTLHLDSIAYREETLAVSTYGTVETGDGRVINLALDLEITQSQYIRETIDTGIVAARFVDPLVLSFDDGLGVLSSSRFLFDLDGDSVCEEVSCLGSGSGYLVLDQNSDGRVNNGLELFGPATGFGYGELGEYDSDNNSWIDENDPIFEKLQIWMGAGSEDQRLVSLKEAGVGALALAHTEVSFELMAGDGRVLGRVKNSGLFLREGGEVRPMAEIDLATGDDQMREDWPELSDTTRQALNVLREMMAERSQRMQELAARWREDRLERHREELLERLFLLRHETIISKEKAVSPSVKKGHGLG